MYNNSLPRWPLLMCSPMWLNVLSFSNRIMLFVRLSLICGENLATHAQYICTPNSPPLTPSQLPMAEPPLMCDPSLMHTRIRLHSYKTYMTVATAKPPGLITIFLILPHPILTAIACHLHIIMNGHPLCSCYATILMLLHVIISLWLHPSIPMMGSKSQEHSTVLNTFLRNHTTSMMKW
jgi:hypothetical protein